MFPQAKPRADFAIRMTCHQGANDLSFTRRQREITVCRPYGHSAAFRHLTVNVKGIEYVPIEVYVRIFFCAVLSLIRSPRSVTFAETLHSSGAIRRIRASVLVFEGSCEQGPKTLRESKQTFQ